MWLARTPPCLPGTVARHAQLHSGLKFDAQRKGPTCVFFARHAYLWTLQVLTGSQKKIIDCSVWSWLNSRWASSIVLPGGKAKALQ
jgi:hypothetical protein